MAQLSAYDDKRAETAHQRVVAAASKENPERRRLVVRRSGGAGCTALRRGDNTFV